jgi:beta-lactamase superfamily II metal-dependent hydrolase
MLRVHFLNVGHGDCTIIKHPSGRLTMIDVNNSQDFDPETFAEELEEERRKQRNALSGGFSRGGLGGLGGFGGSGGSLLDGLAGSGGFGILSEYAAVADRAKRELTDPIEFLKRTYPNETLWRFILTHPDLDHMRELKALYENIGFANFWDTNHTKAKPDFRGGADKYDWNFYQWLRSANSPLKPLMYTRGHSYFAFGKEQNGMPGGDNIEILSPTPELVGECNTAEKSNDLSIVVRIHHAGRSILLSRDAEQSAWDDMVRFYGSRLKSSFLKASHHGRDTGYHLNALRLVAPTMTFVSVGRKPDTDASYKYLHQTGGKVPSTRYYGNIELQINDDGSWRWLVDRNAENS